MIGLLAPHGFGLVQILLICVPATLLATLIAAFVHYLSFGPKVPPEGIEDKKT